MGDRWELVGASPSTDAKRNNSNWPGIGCSSIHTVPMVPNSKSKKGLDGRAGAFETVEWTRKRTAMMTMPTPQSTYREVDEEAHG